jgi:hypothetical protein
MLFLLEDYLTRFILYLVANHEGNGLFFSKVSFPYGDNVRGSSQPP